MRRPWGYFLTAAFALHPMIAYYGANGMSEAPFLLLMLALVVFGVAVDMAHGAVPSETTAYFILGVVEDGGELVVASLILWYVFRLAVHDDRGVTVPAR